MKNIIRESLNGSVKKDGLIRPRSKNGSTHWIEKTKESRFPNIPVSIPAKRNFTASTQYKGNLDGRARRQDTRLDCWQYMQNKKGARISVGFCLMHGDYYDED